MVNVGYEYQGIVTYIPKSETEIGVYGLINLESGYHFWTPYKNTRDAFLSAGWEVNNGGNVMWYALSAQSEDPDTFAELIPTPEPTPTPTPSPSPSPSPSPTPTPNDFDTSDDTEPVNPDDATPTPEPEELIPDEVIDDIIDDFGESFTDEAGTQMMVEDNGTVTVSDDVLGEASVSPTVFVEGKVYTLYNPNTGEHFYTKNPDERKALVEHGWNYESNRSEVAIRADDKGAKPVYRVYNPNAGVHHFTTNQTEARMLQELGWGYEGVSFYAFEANDNQGTSVYRVYCPFPDVNGNNQHVFTSDMSERQHLMNLGYLDEGISWRIK